MCINVLSIVYFYMHIAHYGQKSIKASYTCTWTTCPPRCLSRIAADALAGWLSWLEHPPMYQNVPV